MHQIDQERGEIGVEFGPATKSLARRHHRRTDLQMFEEDLFEDVTLPLFLFGGPSGDHSDLSELLVPTRGAFQEEGSDEIRLDIESLPPKSPRQLIELFRTRAQLGDSQHPLGGAGRVS